jgi:hypothetical protein
MKVRLREETDLIVSERREGSGDLAPTRAQGTGCRLARNARRSRRLAFFGTRSSRRNLPFGDRIIIITRATRAFVRFWIGEGHRPKAVGSAGPSPSLSGEDGTLARTRKRSACRSTLIFFNTARNWLRSVPIAAPVSAAMSFNVLPDMSCTASRASAKPEIGREVVRFGRSRVRIDDDDERHRIGIEAEIKAERRHSQNVVVFTG